MEIPTVYTSSKKIESIDSAPNTMYTVTRDEIKTRGYRDLRDVLSIIPGFGVFLGATSYNAQVRGIAGDSNERVAIMINGHIIEGIHLPTFFTSINLDIVDRIEIIVGPGSVLYGAKALSGIVNLITIKPVGTEAVLSCGNYNNASATLIGGMRVDNKMNVMGSATIFNKGGYNAYPDGATFGTRNADYATGINPSQMLYGQAELGDYSFQASSLHHQLEDVFVSSANADNAKTFQYVDSIGMKRNFHFSSRLTGTLLTGLVMQRWIQNNNNHNTYSWDLSQTSYNFDYEIQHHTERNFFQAGFQYEYNINKFNYDFSNLDTYLPFVSTTTGVGSFVKPIDTKSIGAYVSDDYQLFKQLKIVAAVRSDRNTELTEEKFYFSPRIAFIWTPYHKLTIKAMHNTATRYPLIAESQANNIWGKENTSVNNPNNANYLTSKPETLSSNELQTIYYWGKTRLSMVVYQQTLKDFMAFAIPFTNVGDLDGTGLEFQGNTPVGKRSSWWYNASCQTTRFTLSHNVATTSSGFATFALPEAYGKAVAVPELTANMGIDCGLCDSLTFTAAVRYFTHQPALTRDYSQPTATVDYTVVPLYIDNQYYCDAAMMWKATPSLDLRVSGQNILNNTSKVACQFSRITYIPQGATYSLTAYYRF